MRIILCLLMCLVVANAYSQKFSVNLFAGMAGYNGDLKARATDTRGMHPAIGLGAGYELTEKIGLRAGLTTGKVSFRDAFNEYNTSLLDRNLSFSSRVTEFQLTGYYNFNNLYDRDWTPYVFGGVAVYHFNPYTRDSADNKVYLQPLGTEGQGLEGYPEKYKRTQLAIPFGGGVKFSLSENLQIGAELGIRKLFTDYLDDVSGTYADEAVLRAGNGNQAANLAFRGDEVKAVGYPDANSLRGNAKYKDWYTFTGITVSYKLGKGLFRKNQYGCPKVY